MDTVDEDYEFQEIIDCEVRYNKPEAAEEVGTLELW
jgi:hypothetical protein